MNQLSSVYFLFKVPLNISFYFFKNSGTTSHVINSRTFIKRRRYQNVLLCSAVLYRQTLGFFLKSVSAAGQHCGLIIIIPEEEEEGAVAAG
jgi:hypothetical protein